MHACSNPLEIRQFRSTNAAWNRLHLNDPWSVGYVTTLIESEPFSRCEEWEAYYYRSGEVRNDLLRQQYPQWKELLNDSQQFHQHPATVARLPPQVVHLNTQYGRTAEQLAGKGRVLHRYLVSTGSSISEETCVQAVRFRVIGETWNGVILRERNTVEVLSRSFPEAEFRKTSGVFDHRFAVDYEVFLQDALICGIQIKPQSYRYKTSYLESARQANFRKNELYRQETGKPVWEVISKTDGTVLNPDVLRWMQEALKKAF